MALPTASDNPFPSFLITEGTEPAAPAAGKQRVYIDSTSHHLSRTDSSGVQVDLETNQTAGAVTAHAARATRSGTSFSIGNNTLTAVEFNAEDYDTDTMHDNATNPTRLTIPTITGVTTGLWTIKASGYTDVTTGRTDVAFRLNAAANPASGTAIAFDSFAGTGVSLTGFVLAADGVFTAADYVEVFVRTTAGAGNAVFDSGASPHFSAAFLGKVT